MRRLSVSFATFRIICCPFLVFGAGAKPGAVEQARTAVARDLWRRPGPAQLALALLAVALGDDDMAVRLHQAFKFRVVACWPEGERWWITADQIAAVVKVIKEEAAKRTELPGSTTAAVSTGGPDAA